MKARKKYLSPVIIHPGELVKDWMEEKGVTASEMATLGNTSEASVRSIADCWEDITPVSAAALERATGITARFWLRAQLLYENTLAHLAREKAEKAARRAARRARPRTRPAELAPAGV